MVIFTQTYDLLRWLLPCCEDFPKSQRFVLTARLQGAALDFVETIYAANAEHGEARLRLLRLADGHMNTRRLYLRLAQQFEWLRPGQFPHVSKMVNESCSSPFASARAAALARPAAHCRNAPARHAGGTPSHPVVEPGDGRMNMAEHTTRKPLLLLRFAGWLLFRYAARALLELLFHDPPHKARIPASTSGSSRSAVGQYGSELVKHLRQNPIRV
jgi:hypothetical protein